MNSYHKYRLLLSIFILFFSVNNICSQELIVKGVYQGENLFIQNPFQAIGVGFCVNEVRINGQMSTDEIESNAFEIDFSHYQLKIGDAVKVVIKHKADCKPVVLNMDVIEPKSTFNLKSIAYDKNSSMLKWTTTDELVSLPYIVQQFKWKKWVTVATVKGKGSKRLNSYQAKVETHSGKNIFRVKQVDSSKKPRYSSELTFRSLLPLITFSPTKPKTEIKFSNVTDYAIYNFYGELVKKGRSKVVNVSGLKKGNYFLNYDNTTGSFIKK